MQVFTNLRVLVTALSTILLSAGCATEVGEGSTAGGGGMPSTPGGAPNVVGLTIDGSTPQNGPMVSVTICEPGSTNCQTISHILVDTASTGLRIFSGQVTVPLAEETDSSGNAIADCAWNFWGYINIADVQIGGLKAPQVPIEIIVPGDGNTPASCGVDNNYYPGAFNGIIGVSPSLVDTMPWGYYTCNGNGCQPANVDPSLQTPNPVAMFPTDNNGCVVSFPTIANSESPLVHGRLTFGVGTRANNQPPSSLLPIPLNETWGQFQVESEGTVYQSAFDSGTWSYNVPFMSQDLCPNNSPYLCPSNTTMVPVQILDTSSDIAYATTIDVGNFNQFPTGTHASSNLGTAWPGSQQLMLGIPYFFGRSLFYAYDQQPTPLGTGPWVGVPGTVDPNQYYRIENVATGYSLDSNFLNPTGNYSGQAWLIHSLPNGYARLTNNYMGTGQALDTANDGVYEPVMAPVGSTTGQFWQLTLVGDGQYRLTNQFRGTSNSLEVESDGSMHMAANTTAPTQLWTVTPF